MFLPPDPPPPASTYRPVEARTVQGGTTLPEPYIGDGQDVGRDNPPSFWWPCKGASREGQPSLSLHQLDRAGQGGTTLPVL